MTFCIGHFSNINNIDLKGRFKNMPYALLVIMLNFIP